MLLAETTHRRPTRVPDLDRAERAARELIAALGMELDEEARRRTPRRMVQALADVLTPAEFELTTFAHDSGHSSLVLVRSIPLRALCEHHLLPFVGVAHVGYVPDSRLAGLSKLARVVDAVCSRPQVQERLTQHVADQLEDALAPRGVAVMVEAEHMCMTLRGVRSAGADTLTTAYRGVLADDPRQHLEFVQAATRRA
jgi:GTP cyclohydrolase I